MVYASKNLFWKILTHYPKADYMQYIMELKNF